MANAVSRSASCNWASCCLAESAAPGAVLVPGVTVAGLRGDWSGAGCFGGKGGGPPFSFIGVDLMSGKSNMLALSL
ncbi:hypothetical protein Q667_01185 [Marinobacter sp. C1S70]|nr:hypothetical protein Q667_01185 [Marinobacter sp. C1S70]